jgi:hypothetical protein
MEHKKFSELLPLYPFLLGLYPVLALYLFNIQQVPAYAILRAFLVSLGVTGVIWLACLLLYRQRVKAALAASLLLILFFTYGHLYSAIYHRQLLGFTLGRHAILAVFWALLGLAWLVYVARLHHPEWLNRQFYLISSVLAVMLLAQFLVVGLRYAFSPRPQAHPPTAESAAPQAGETSPDVYYILIDSYARSDILKTWNFDNSRFIQELTDLGFTVLPQAHSNYTNTIKSLSSALNINYLDQFGIPDTLLSDDPLITTIGSRLIKNSKVAAAFKQMGYRTYAFATKAAWANVDTADVYYNVAADTPDMDREETLKFNELFLSTTYFRVLLDANKNAYIRFNRLPVYLLSWVEPSADVFNTSRYKEYLQNRYSFQQLAKIPAQPGKKLVIAHLMAAHSSYVFNPDGSFRTDENENASVYLQELQYVDGQLIPILRTIIDESKVKPIIVIQGDHSVMPGPAAFEVLNAFYLPDGGSAKLYPTLTPVNTFRLILNTYFDGSYQYLPDQNHVTP